MPPLWHAQPFRSDESAAGKYRFGISLTCALIAPLVRGRSRSERGIGSTSRGPKFALQTLGFMGGAHEWRWPRRLTSAPASVDTVAAFRPWRSFRPSVARGRQGHHGDLLACDVGVGAKLAERGFVLKNRFSTHPNHSRLSPPAWLGAAILHISRQPCCITTARRALTSRAGDGRRPA